MRGQRSEDRGQKVANPPSPASCGAAREEMRELIACVKPVAMRERMLKVLARI